MRSLIKERLEYAEEVLILQRKLKDMTKVW
jgi:hypothetical protein